MSARTPRWTNPYRLLLVEYPGKIFSFREERESDSSALGELLTTASERYCEIGSGSGNHLNALAVSVPDALVFGFELRYKRAVRTIQKAADGDVENVYVLRTSGKEIAEIFPPASLRGLYVNFPEPWDKLKQRKHRVLNPEFLEHASVLLEPQGFVSVKTDLGEYFESFLRDVETHGVFVVESITRDLYSSEFLEDNIPSEFEMLFKRKGMPIHFVRLRRRGEL